MYWAAALLGILAYAIFLIENEQPHDSLNFPLHVYYGNGFFMGGDIALAYKALQAFCGLSIVLLVSSVLQADQGAFRILLIWSFLLPAILLSGFESRASDPYPGYYGTGMEVRSIGYRANVQYEPSKIPKYALYFTEDGGSRTHVPPGLGGFLPAYWYIWRIDLIVIWVAGLLGVLKLRSRKQRTVDDSS
jgi:hypothetical protein